MLAAVLIAYYAEYLYLLQHTRLKNNGRALTSVSGVSHGGTAHFNSETEKWDTNQDDGEIIPTDEIGTVLWHRYLSQDDQVLYYPPTTDVANDIQPNAALNRNNQTWLRQLQNGGGICYWFTDSTWYTGSTNINNEHYFKIELHRYVEGKTGDQYEADDPLDLVTKFECFERTAEAIFQKVPQSNPNSHQYWEDGGDGSYSIIYKVQHNTQIAPMHPVIALLTITRTDGVQETFQECIVPVSNPMQPQSNNPMNYQDFDIPAEYEIFKEKSNAKDGTKVIEPYFDDDSQVKTTNINNYGDIKPYAFTTIPGTVPFKQALLSPGFTGDWVGNDYVINPPLSKDPGVYTNLLVYEDDLGNKSTLWMNFRYEDETYMPYQPTVPTTLGFGLCHTDYTVDNYVTYPSGYDQLPQLVVVDNTKKVSIFVPDVYNQPGDILTFDAQGETTFNVTLKKTDITTLSSYAVDADVCTVTATGGDLPGDDPYKINIVAEVGTYPVLTTLGTRISDWTMKTPEEVFDVTGPNGFDGDGTYSFLAGNTSELTLKDDTQTVLVYYNGGFNTIRCPGYGTPQGSYALITSSLIKYVGGNGKLMHCYVKPNYP